MAKYVTIEEESILVSIKELVPVIATIDEFSLIVDICDTEAAIQLCPDVAVANIEEPTLAVSIVEEKLVINIESCFGGADGGTSSTGEIFILNVTGAGIIANKQYEPDNIPPDTVLVQCLTDNDSVEVHFLAHGGERYSPVITIDSVECTNLQQYSDDRRIFYGSIPITVTETTTVTVRSSTGTLGNVLINRAAGGPAILSCLIGDLPGTQTAAKQNDSVTITGTVESEATHVRIIDFGAFTSSGWYSCSGGVFSMPGVISSRTGTFSARVEAKNDIGTIGDEFESSNQILLDQLYPEFTDNGTIWPVGQTAFKGNEIGSQSVTVINATRFTYLSPNGDFIINDPGNYDEAKQITCTNPGNYNDSSTNFRINATRLANNAQRTFNKTIEVADIEPIVSVTQPQTRLQSSPFGTDYNISANSNQNLASAPVIGIPVSGTWQGTGFAGGPKNWWRAIRITDADSKGTGAWFWSSTPPRNRAGIDAVINGSEVVGGFHTRDIELAPFATVAQLETAVVNTNKLSMTWSFKEPMLFQSIGTPSPVANGWTIDALNVNPTDVIILDTAAANSSSQSSIITIGEVS